ncbi:MAG: LysR substrate-binding domain-containing protein [Marinobacterium sp.]|nr:LysR substrate-binding domain-containing protein [Marinobacterium sp.]
MQRWEGVTEFVTVAETGSFTASAHTLGISIAQVSRQVSALENRLATRLFYRTTRKVSLTEAGTTYYQHCRQVLDSLEDAERAISDLSSEPRGRLKLTAPGTYGELRIAPLVNTFIAQYPALELQFRLTNQTVDLVAGGFDLAIRPGRLADSTMMARRLASRVSYICATPAYLAQHGTPQNLTALAEHNCLLNSRDYWRLQEAGQERNVRVSGNIRCNSGPALLDAALKGLGLVQLPDYYVEPWLASGDLVTVLQDYQPEEEGIWGLYPHNRHPSPKVTLLLDHLAAGLNTKA